MVQITELAPSSSSSSAHTPGPAPGSSSSSIRTYDAFLSFRGVDTRNTFTDHLYNALLDAGFNTFLDDEDIETGEPLKPELESAIQSSRASVIVLSPNYASSTWCLDELVLILEQKRNFNQIVIPVFYHVEPTDVRKQQGSFGEAMAVHKQRMKAETNAEKRTQWAEKMELWKRALTEVSNLKGKDAKGRKETEFINELVTTMHRRLGAPLTNTLPLLIGRDYNIEFISSWLSDGSSHKIDILTVVGMSGIGKTSLAKHVFQLHSSNFSKSSFIEGISATCNQQFNGLLNLQKKLHGDISRKFPFHVNVNEYTSRIEQALTRKRVFIVLDDIGSLHQLDALLGDKGLYTGSKVIITTKDASLTERCALFNSDLDPNHIEVFLNGLYETEALELLCIHAFKTRSPKPKEGYKEVSEELVKYCDGHPLALEVLGRSLHKRDVSYWEDCIKGLKKEPHPDMKKALQMSIHLLPSENNKELFKHIACFFVGKERDLIETILNACEIETRSGVRILIERCLLSIGCNNELMMHQLVQEMGRDLVRQESPHKPWERSRLWCHEESFRVLKQKRGTDNLLGLALDMRMVDEKKLRGSFELQRDSLSKMDNLMLLQLNYVQLHGFFEDVPEELRWLCMHGFSLKSITLDIPMENLVALDLSYSNIESFDMSYSSPQRPAMRQKQLVESSSKDVPFLGSLKILDLSFCDQLHSLGGFSEIPALERLIVRKCINLIEVCESVGQCHELAYIDLSNCHKLKKVPTSIGKLKKVKTLLLDGCFNSSELQSSDLDINSQSSSSSIMEAIPKFFVAFLPQSLVILSLANNNLSNESFPMDFSGLSMLEELCLDGNPIVSMPSCVRSLSRLERLYMENCNMLISIEQPPRALRELSYSEASLRKVKFDPEMASLRVHAGEKVHKNWSLEIDGMVKIQDMVDVEDKVLHRLGWNDLRGRLRELPQTQVCYEFGIFNTFYEWEEMPELVKWRNTNPFKDPLISFTIPSSRHNLRGLNLFCTMVSSGPYAKNDFDLPMIKIRNTTKKLTWIYRNYITFDITSRGHSLVWLSHWMFGPNEMKARDKITITLADVKNEHHYYNQDTKEFGVSLVYDDDGKSEEHDDPLCYYKSWNHIIGGDLSPFQLKTGEYVLDNWRFMRHVNETFGRYRPLVDGSISYKEDEVNFRAFFQKGPEIVSQLQGQIWGRKPATSTSLPTHQQHVPLLLTPTTQAIDDAPLDHHLASSSTTQISPRFSLSMKPSHRKKYNFSLKKWLHFGKQKRREEE